MAGTRTRTRALKQYSSSESRRVVFVKVNETRHDIAKRKLIAMFETTEKA